MLVRSQGQKFAVDSPGAGACTADMVVLRAVFQQLPADSCALLYGVVDLIQLQPGKTCKGLNRQDRR